MKTIVLTAALALVPALGWANGSGISVSDAWVPLAPPAARAHAAYMQIENIGCLPRNLVDVRVEGYAMAHIHQSMEHNGVAMMHAMDQITLEAGQVVPFARGGLHIMLMRPTAPKAEGDLVDLTLIFADGEEVPVTATVRRPNEGS